MNNADSPAFSVLRTIGLTKREYFAGLAMQGLLANSAYNKSVEVTAANLSLAAVICADSILAELEKTNNNG